MDQSVLVSSLFLPPNYCPIEPKDSQAEEVTQLRMKVAELQAAANKVEPDRPNVDYLSRKLQVAEAEVARLRLRINGRPMPYYTVLAEFFPTKLDKFVPPEHNCTCKV